MPRRQRAVVGLVKIMGASQSFALLFAALPHHYGRTNTVLWAQALYIGIAAMGLNLLTGYNGPGVDRPRRVLRPRRLRDRAVDAAARLAVLPRC